MRWRVNAGKVCGWRDHVWQGVYFFGNPVTWSAILDAIYEKSEEGEAFPCPVCNISLPFPIYFFFSVQCVREFASEFYVHAHNLTIQYLTDNY